MAGAKANHYRRQMSEIKKFDFPWILTSWVAAYKKTQYASPTFDSLSIWLKSADEIQMISLHVELGKHWEYFFNWNFQNSFKPIVSMSNLFVGSQKSQIPTRGLESLPSCWGQFEVGLRQLSHYQPLMF